MKPAVPAELIHRKIYLIRGQKVMLDSDLAELYGVPTKQLNQAVRRNLERFPDDFMFQLTEKEEESLRSQIVTLNGAGKLLDPLRSQIATLKISRRGKHRKYPTFAFTEHGISMLSSILNSPRAVQVNIAIVRTFIQLRRMLADNELLARRLDELEGRYDGQFQMVFEAIRELLTPPDASRRKIGF